MHSKVIGIVLGIAGVLLWFMPLVTIQFMGMTGYQSGSQVGGIAYLLLLASISYALLSWREQHVLRIIAASTALLITVLLVVQAGSQVAWGLVSLLIVSALSVGFAVRDLRAAPALPHAAGHGPHA